jgi:hypothetical protein
MPSLEPGTRCSAGSAAFYWHALIGAFFVDEYEITCINKPHHQSPYEHITHIGNSAGQWRITRNSAISRITNRTARFFTVDTSTGRRVYLEVVSNDGNKPSYLKTVPDGKLPDNLLSQKECGSGCKIVD